MDESDIQFGDVEETMPEELRRPDRNKHYAVAALGTPRDADLPIFVDMDAMRDMEIHAQSDTSVELGGVLLGGQYVDEDGQAFVLVTDSLRAKHYESTKGSFKFTHDTWSEITRERDEFPAELQMVGWYHTHPDWGVFLSGMDMFICQNFFNKPLDVALVIDPCRGDRGMFEWLDNGRETRRTGGFYLIGSRFRERELDEYVQRLEGEFPMAHDPRYAGSGVPIINVGGGNNYWQSLATMGMLTLQFCLLALISWRLLGGAAASTESSPNSSKQLAAIEGRLAELVEARQTAERTQIQMDVLEDVVAGLGQGGTDHLVQSLHRTAEENTLLQESLLGQKARLAQLAGDVETLTDISAVQAQTIEEQKAWLKQLRADAEAERATIVRLKSELKDATQANKKEADAEPNTTPWNWAGWAFGAVCLIFAGLTAFFRGRSEDTVDADVGEQAGAQPTGPEPAQETEGQADIDGA